MALDAQTRINLTALKRQDPYISNIIDSSTQVAVYTFNNQTGEWEKTDVEGALFVYSRLAPPTAGFTIMNRLSMDNLAQPLTSEMDFQKQEPFLLYRNAKLAIFGIWFYDMYDCHRIGNLLVELCKSSKTEPVSIPKSKGVQLLLPNSNSSSNASSMSDSVTPEEFLENQVSPEGNGIPLRHNNSSQKSVNILDILGKAQDNYDKNRGKKIQDDHELKSIATKPDCFKPIAVKSDPKKFTVESLFGQPMKDDLHAEIPSTTNVQITSNTKNSQSVSSHASVNHPRYSNRSQSLSMTDEQLHSRPPKSIVNGAINVEELESPVLGMPAQRTRYHSISETVMHNNHSPRTFNMEDIGPFHKLLGKMASLTAHDNRSSAPSRTVTNTSAKTSNSAEKTGGNTNRHPRAKLQRSVSSPSGVGVLDVEKTSHAEKSHPQNSKLSSTSMSSISVSNTSSVSPFMPTLHENDVPSMMRSMSVASGLPPLPNAVKQHRMQVAAALHGTANKAPLLTPHALQLKTAQFSPTLSRPYSTTSSVSTTPLSLTCSVNTSASVSSKSKTLISPEDFEHSSAEPQKAMELRQRLLPSDAANDSKLLLNKEQLTAALVSLLQSDSGFIDAVHKAYLSGLENTH